MFSTVKTAITFQIERWSDFYPDSKALFPAHWKELALNQDEVPLDIDVEGYERLEQLGILMILTARADGELIGYVLSFLMPHLHYKSSGPMCVTDMYYVAPEFRHGVGAIMFQAWERELKKRGIKKAVTSCKVHQDHSPLFFKLGWTHSDHTFVKVLV